MVDSQQTHSSSSSSSSAAVLFYVPSSVNSLALVEQQSGLQLKTSIICKWTTPLASAT